MSQLITNTTTAPRFTEPKDSNPYINAAVEANANSIAYWKLQVGKLETERNYMVQVYNELKESYDNLLTDYQTLQVSYSELEAKSEG